MFIIFSKYDKLNQINSLHGSYSDGYKGKKNNPGGYPSGRPRHVFTWTAALVSQ